MILRLPAFMKMSVEHWWNGTKREKLKYWERNII